MYRKKGEQLEFFLGHPGGPFFSRKDEGAWGVPKGEVKEGEDLLEGAKREFKEETGIDVMASKFIELGEIKLNSSKMLHVWAFEGDWNGLLVSNYFSMEWPLKSGMMKTFPELDKAKFFSTEEARVKMNAKQFEFIDRLMKKL